MKTLITKLGVDFQNEELLDKALTHRSYLNESDALESNERMEFLGDAVLELVVSEYLFIKYPAEPEGILTNYRSALVKTESLAETARKLDLGSKLKMSKGEEQNGGRENTSLLANTFEAVIGAIYLDGGYDASKKFIEKFILKELSRIIENQLYRDAKSLFQEKAQEKAGITPTYEVIKEWGPDHARNFQVGVFLEKEMVGVGDGPSKQEAQQVAASDALKKKGW